VAGYRNPHLSGHGALGHQLFEQQLSFGCTCLKVLGKYLPHVPDEIAMLGPDLVKRTIRKALHQHFIHGLVDPGLQVRLIPQHLVPQVAPG